MTGNGKNTTYKKIVFWGMIYYCVTHITPKIRWLKLGTRPLEGRGFFVINGVSWMILDVLVPIGFCLM